MDVYLVEDCGLSPGKVYGVFAEESDADDFAARIEQKLDTATCIEKRTLFYGQPPVCGYNK